MGGIAIIAIIMWVIYYVVIKLAWIAIPVALVFICFGFKKPIYFLFALISVAFFFFTLPLVKNVSHAESKDNELTNKIKNERALEVALEVEREKSISDYDCINIAENICMSAKNIKYNVRNDYITASQKCTSLGMRMPQNNDYAIISSKMRNFQQTALTISDEDFIKMAKDPVYELHLSGMYWVYNAELLKYNTNSINYLDFTKRSGEKIGRKNVLYSIPFMEYIGTETISSDDFLRSRSSSTIKLRCVK